MIFLETRYTCIILVNNIDVVRFSQLWSSIYLSQGRHQLSQVYGINLFQMGIEYPTIEEAQLLRKLADGDAAAFTALYHRHGRKLHAHLLRMIKSEETASEVFQEIFMKIWERRERIDPDKSFGAYLYRIAENKVYDHFREMAREKRLADDLTVTMNASYIDTEDLMNYDERFRLMNEAIGKLPPVRKQIYMLSKIDGKSYEEIAVQMSISTATVNDHIVKANRFLKRLLASHINVTIPLMLLFIP